LWVLSSNSALAQACSDYGGVLDGFAGDIAPSQLQIDQNCTIRNYPASNPLRTNFSFYTQPGQTDERWLIVFDNVVHTGNMSCNSVLEHKIWFTNGSSTKIQEGCQNLLIPVEKIDKQNPAGQTTAAIGVPFTYTLKMPVLYDSGTGTVINNSGSLNDLHSVTLTDDLNATGVDLTYVSHTAYWEGSGAPIALTFSNVGGVLSFDNFPIIPAGEQIIIEITVVLEDTLTNAPGTQFINTAKWNFGRLIDGVFYEPLPGEWGISEPLTIAAPNLTVTKTGPATLGRTLNLGEWGQFGIDVQNTGLSDAWNVTLLDRLPDGPTGGMCNVTPQILSAQVFAADGITPVSGKGPLVPGTDFSISYSSAPACELTLTMLTAVAAIGPGERLIIAYQTQLDADSQDGATLTNVVGATQWFNGDVSNVDRLAFNRTLTNGTVGTLDHEDAHTVTVALYGYFFEKSVQDLNTGANPATTAAPGDTLRYTLRLQATDVPLSGLRFYDDLGELNPTAAFVPGSLTLVGALPPGADASNTNPAGGTNGAGIIDIRNIDVPAFSDVSVQFDIVLDATLADGTVVTNQADLLAAAKLADSDDPYVNGQSDPSVIGDEDPTRLIIEATPPPALLKASTQATAAVGEEFSYLVTVPSAPHSAPLYDVRILDDLSASAANIELVSVAKISGSGSWTPVNTGTATNLVIEDPGGGIDIPAGEQVTIEITVRLLDTSTNVAGLVFTNTAYYTYDLIDSSPTSVRPGDPGTSGPMTIVEPELTLEKTGPVQMQIGVPGTFSLNVHNVGDSSAYSLTLIDVLPNTATGGMCDAAPTQLSVQLFEADGVTPVAPALTAGTDYAIAFSGDPTCVLTLTMLTPAAAIAPDQRLIVSYDASLDPGTQDPALTNVAGATSWFSVDITTPNDQAREYRRNITDGTVGTLDHEDAHTVTINLAVLQFLKTVSNVTTGVSPAVTASPGDTLRYSLLIENVTDIDLADFSVIDEVDRLNAIPAFVPGSLAIVTLPAGADGANTNPNGGASGTGLLDVRNLSIGGLGETVLIEFELTLAPVIANGTLVLNQSQLSTAGYVLALSDDPNVNGAADPNVDGDEDPTQIQITSAPYFDVDKVSAYITGDPTVLLAGETLRYTITVANIGTDHATDAAIRDDIPANTTYVSGSTTLNGAAIADPAAGVSPLSAGIAISAPEDPTPGTLRADPTAPASATATIVFDVIVDPNVIDGTIISNQAFVSAVDGGVVDQQSDDPRTPVLDDPTRDVVGALPLIYAEKSAALQIDAGTQGVVDPGDVLRYTITMYNNGSVDATEVVLTDGVPLNTTYVADSTTLNGLAVGQPDGGLSPLAAGIPISSADLTPPLPGVGGGTLTAGQSAVLQFDLQVDAGVAPGTLITNQALVSSYELPDVPTDGDGNPATGPEPTVVVVGPGQQLTVSKQVAVVGGGPAVAGATLEYTVRVLNIAAVPASYVVITDDLDMATPNYLQYVAGSATMNGSTNGVTYIDPLITADYASTYGDLAPGAEIVLRFQAVIDPTLAIGTIVTNTANVTWNDPPQYATASVSIAVGGVPGVGILSGTAWHDSNFDNVLDPTEQLLEGWVVDLYRNGDRIHTTFTGTDGTYRIIGVAPNYLTTDEYELRFVAPGAGPNTALLGLADSVFANYLQRIGDIVVQSGSNLLDLNLPIDPNGVVYNAMSRTPIPGAILTLVDAGSGAVVPASCFDDAAQQDQITRSDGFYKFDLDFTAVGCPTSGNYLIQLTVPAAGYVAGVSAIIPPTTDATTSPLNVPFCPGTPQDAIPATTQYCEAQPYSLAPPSSVPARAAGTEYYLHLMLDGTQPPGSAQIFNNHIPVDPDLNDAVSISKTTPLINVTRGQLVPYTITVDSEVDFDLSNLTIADRFPAGFRYITDSARIDGEPSEPTVNGRELLWTDLGLTGSGRHTLQLLFAVGGGISEGEYVNRAQAMHSLTGALLSGEATATVRLAPDATFDCTDVMGKVFNDTNRNGVQDLDEAGIGGVRLVTATGLAAVTDEYGRYHITCATVPREGRGSNFVVKVDDRTLPTGFRSSTPMVQMERATRGKTLRFNFGASIHRVVGLDVADPVFEPGSTQLRTQWAPRIGLLLEELRKGPATLRLSYLADVEDPRLVNDRVAAIKNQITTAWQALNCCYTLVIEPEIFWRRGQPPEQPRDSGTVMGENR